MPPRKNYCGICRLEVTAAPYCPQGHLTDTFWMCDACSALVGWDVLGPEKGRWVGDRFLCVACAGPSAAGSPGRIVLSSGTPTAPPPTGACPGCGSTALHDWTACVPCSVCGRPGFHDHTGANPPPPAATPAPTPAAPPSPAAVAREWLTVHLRARAEAAAATAVIGQPGAAAAHAQARALLESLPGRSDADVVALAREWGWGRPPAPPSPPSPASAARLWLRDRFAEETEAMRREMDTWRTKRSRVGGSSNRAIARSIRRHERTWNKAEQKFGPRLQKALAAEESPWSMSDEDVLRLARERGWTG